MKIAQVVCAFPPYAGGIGNSAYQIGQLLADKHEVTNFTPDNMKPWLRYGHGAFLPSLLWRLRRFDYIYLHYPFFGTAEVVWLFKLFNKKTKLIIHYHMDVKNLSALAKILSLPSRLIRSSLLNQAETIVTASLDYIENSQIKKDYQKYPEKFREIPFGIDLDKFQPKLINREQRNSLIARAKEIVHYINDKFIKRDRINLLFVGGLDKAHYFKGVSVLFNALLLLPTANWRLVVAGEGDLRFDYERLALKLKIADRIDFVGRLSEDEKVRAYQNAELLILPSINRNEAFGLVLIEAMACGVPVIASDLPGVRSVFRDQKEGLLVKPGDAEDLRDKLAFVFNNEDKRRIMAISARQRAEERYDVKKMKIELEKLFV